MSTSPASTGSVSVRPPDPPKHRSSLIVTSKSIADGATIAMDHVYTGCGGRNVSPQLSWSGAPADAKSYAVTCFDPDAPTGSGYWHWLAFDIPASVRSLDAGAGTGSSSPGGGKSGFSDFALNSYGGPCPPKGDKAHRYIFTVYALDVAALGAGDKTTGATLVFTMRGHVLATGSVTGWFGH
jgi:Raf kinase inhibitor-like YbhB/YbcL family protein